jgi:kynurenine formamidase
MPGGTAHYPGWSMEVLKYLYETRLITASGHEPTDTDPALLQVLAIILEAYILSTNHYRLSCSPTLTWSLSLALWLSLAS